MEPQDKTPTVLNAYDPKAGVRTACGVLSSLFVMGLPVGLTELLRAGGDLKVAMYGGLATAVAAVLAWVSIHGSSPE